jgi:hypothetical protein
MPAPAVMAARITAGLLVSTERGTGLGNDSLDDRHDTIELLLHGHCLRTRARRLSSDVDDRGTCVNHRERMPHSAVAIVKTATVGERIRCQIENPHHDG